MLDFLTKTPDLRTLPAREAHLAMTVRLWVVVGKLGRDPLPALTERLGSEMGAARLHLFLEQVGAVWVDPFCVNPPCCPRLSHDEALVLDMLALAANGDRPGFDRLLSDLLAADARDRLFDGARRFTASLPATQPLRRD